MCTVQCSLPKGPWSFLDGWKQRSQRRSFDQKLIRKSLNGVRFPYGSCWWASQFQSESSFPTGLITTLRNLMFYFLRHSIVLTTDHHTYTDHFKLCGGFNPSEKIWTSVGIPQLNGNIKKSCSKPQTSHPLVIQHRTYPISSWSIQNGDFPWQTVSLPVGKSLSSSHQLPKRSIF